jgi:hypothetical protein
LTYLDFSALHKQGTDIQRRLEYLESENIRLKKSEQQYYDMAKQNHDSALEYYQMLKWGKRLKGGAEQIEEVLKNKENISNLVAEVHSQVKKREEEHRNTTFELESQVRN